MERTPSWLSKYWFVSPLNFADEVRRDLNLPERVVVHDTTLRDGEQLAGVVFRRDERVRIAAALDEAGVGRVEAGMPAVSQEDFEAVREVARLGLRARVLAYARCLTHDIDLALRADVSGVVIDVPVSSHLIRYAYGWSEEEAVERAVKVVEYAKQHGLSVVFFAVDLTRADVGFLRRVLESVQNLVDSITIVDTFGVASPFAMRYLTNLVKSFSGRPLEVHAHNDFGLAVANTLVAVASGATAVHVTVNGIGERAGNAPLEETVVALELLLGVRTGVRLDRLYELSKLVESLSGVRLPPHKPVVGDGPYSVESGLLADWWLEVRDLRPTDVFPILPELVGRKQGVSVVLGKKSGRANVVEALRSLGIDPAKVGGEHLARILQEVKFYSTLKKGPLTREEFSAIVRKVLGT
jgi:methanogen homocitrate synthase